MSRPWEGNEEPNRRKDGWFERRRPGTRRPMHSWTPRKMRCRRFYARSRRRRRSLRSRSSWLSLTAAWRRRRSRRRRSCRRGRVDWVPPFSELEWSERGERELGLPRTRRRGHYSRRMSCASSLLTGRRWSRFPTEIAGDVCGGFRLVVLVEEDEGEINWWSELVERWEFMGFELNRSWRWWLDYMSCHDHLHFRFSNLIMSVFHFSLLFIVQFVGVLFPTCGLLLLINFFYV